MFLSKFCHLLVICIAFLVDATYSIFYIDQHFLVLTFSLLEQIRDSCMVVLVCG